MSNRPTKEIKTSGDHVIVIYEYLTGLEVENIRNFYAGKAQINSISQEGGKVEAGISGISADAALETKRYTFKTVILSVDGIEENVDQIVLELPNDEYQEVLEVVNELLEGKKK